MKFIEPHDLDTLGDVLTTQLRKTTGDGDTGFLLVVWRTYGDLKRVNLVSNRVTEECDSIVAQLAAKGTKGETQQ